MALLTPGFSVNAEELSKEEIGEKFLEIDDKYDIGEEFDDDDAEFVAKYADENSTSDDSVKLQDHYNIAGEGKAPTGSEEAKVLGSYTYDSSHTKGSYDISMTTKMSSGHADKIINKYTHTAYGVIGSGGIGKVYSKDDSRSSTDGDSLYSHFSNEYAAVVWYDSTVIQSTVYYDDENSSFDIDTDVVEQ